MVLYAALKVNNDQIGYIEIQRREPKGKPIRREPEPIIERPEVKTYYETHTMGNDVYTYDWRVSYKGSTHTNLDDQPLEHRYGDGAIRLIQKVLNWAYGPVEDDEDPA